MITGYCKFCDKVILNAPLEFCRYFKEYNAWACPDCVPRIERKLLAKEIAKNLAKLNLTQKDFLEI